MVINISNLEIDMPGEGGTNYKKSVKCPDRYIDISYIGQGSFGLVMSGQDSQVDKKVVIKKISALKIADKYLKHILREILIMKWALSIDIVQQNLVYMDLLNGLPSSVYIVMDYCGPNLRDIVFQSSKLELDQMANILYCIARGLNFLHALKVYHRDLKPGNVCIDTRDFSAKIIDLGLARVKPEESSELTRRIATTCYRAPENLVGFRYGPKLDVWSLGCIFGFMLDGNHIFHDPNLEGITSITMKKIFVLLGLPPQAFINLFRTECRRVNPAHFRYFHELIETYQDHTPTMPNLFDRFHNEPKKAAGIKLLSGLLRWDHSERYTISHVLKSDFVEANRQISLETLPDKDLCEAVSEALTDHEEKAKHLKGNSLKEYLRDFIIDKYPGYPDSNDPNDIFSYETTNRSWSTRSKIMTAGAIALSLSFPLLARHIQYELPLLKIGAVTLLVASIALKRFIQ